jgi:hypothetical protein
LECCKFICKHLMSDCVVTVGVVFFIPISMGSIVFVFLQNRLKVRAILV